MDQSDRQRKRVSICEGSHGYQKDHISVLLLIEEALHSIAESLEKIANPLVVINIPEKKEEETHGDS